VGGKLSPDEAEHWEHQPGGAEDRSQIGAIGEDLGETASIVEDQGSLLS
jgi:hypothetical protein